MTLGKKIGGGFCIILILTFILGFVAYKAMSDGTEASSLIATDRVPRLVDYSNLQSNLLQGAYYVRAYFSTRNDQDLAQGLDFFKALRGDIAALRDLNKKHFYQQTNDFLDLFEKEVAMYEEMIRTGKTALENSQQMTADMFKTATAAKAKMRELLTLMVETQRSYIDSGNLNAATQYARNILDVATIQARVSNVLEELLVAERDKNMAEFTRLRGTLPEIAKDLQAIYPNLTRAEGRELFNQAKNAYEAFSTDASEVVTLQTDLAQIEKNRIEHYQKMYDQSVKIADTTEVVTQQVVVEAEQSLSRSTFVVTILLIAVLIIGILVAIFITRMIVRPLATTQRFAEAVAGGDLDEELTVKANDETGRLADALRSMVKALKANISEAQQKSVQAQKATEEAQQAMGRAEEAARKAESAKRDGMLAAANQLEGMVEIISSASTQLSAQIEQSDRGASESAQRLQEAATAMNEMNATVQEVARNAGSASTASSDTKQKAEAGEHVVQQVVQSIGEVQQVSLQLKDDMAQLNERAQDINRIMGVISDIADQTNLLALNAAIEAARAGEAGRGFAVVADEVRKLAEKTMTSTLDVSNAIRAIQESTDKSMSAVDNAVSRISEATELANQSGAALEEIVATVEATSDQVQAIAAASEEQSAASEEINRSIIEVNDMSRLTAEAMAEANQAVSDLANQAHKLTDLIQQMKNA